MSLSGWFKEYLYIPLGGNRRGKFRTVVNKMIVFVCTGIWHGASFNFLFWGIYHGFFLMLEEYIPFIGKKGGKLKSFFQHVYALLVVCVGFVFFRADTMKQGCFWIREMFTDFGCKASAMSLTLQQLTPRQTQQQRRPLMQQQLPRRPKRSQSQCRIRKLLISIRQLRSSLTAQKSIQAEA